MQMQMPVSQMQVPQMQMQQPQPFPQYTSLTNNTPMQAPVRRNVQGGMYGSRGQQHQP